MHRHQERAGDLAAFRLVHVRQQRQAIDKRRQRRVGIARLELPRHRHQLHQVLDSSVGLFALLFAQVAQIARPIEQQAEHRGNGLPLRRRRHAEQHVAKRRQRRRLAGGHAATGHRRVDLGPQRVRGFDVVEPGQQRWRADVGRRGVDALEGVHHALADAARRHVDDAPQRHVVVRVQHQLQIGERVLDLAAFVEAGAAEHLIRDAGRAQAVFHRARLRVGAVEDGGRGGVVGLNRLAHDLDDEVGLVEFVGAAIGHNRRPAGLIRPQHLVFAAAVVADDGRRRIENDLRRAVVAFELDGHRVWEVALEVEDVLHIGAAPLVDRLVGVADHAQVAVHAHELLHEQVLRPVGVLIFVDHREAEAPRVALAHGRRGVEEFDGLEQQVVEVEGAGFLERVEIALVQLADVAVAQVPRVLERLGPFHAVLRVADARQHHARLERRVVHAGVFHELLDHRLLIAGIVDGEAARQTEVVGFAAEQLGAERVEGRDPHALAVALEQRAHAVAHLFGSLVGEGHRQHLIERCVALLDEMGDAVRDDARLTGAGAGQDEQRPVDVLDGRALFGVQGGEEVHRLAARG